MLGLWTPNPQYLVYGEPCCTPNLKIDQTSDFKQTYVNDPVAW
jgi:hypothetical protein